MAEAKRVLAVLPRFREENAEIEHWLPVSFPKEPDKAIVYADPFDCARFGMDFEHATVVVGMVQEGGPIPATEQRIVSTLIGYGLLAAVPSLVALIVLAARS